MMTEYSENTYFSDIFSAWGKPFQAYGCPACGQAYLAENLSAEVICPNCAQAALLPQNAAFREEPPEMMLKFKHSVSGLKNSFDTYVKKVLIRPEDFTGENLSRRCKPVFWPMWMVDCDVKASWQAEAGFDYQVKSSQEYYQSGQWRTREVKEDRVRWEPRVGLLQRHYDNAIAPALEEHETWKKRLGSYRFNEAVRYTPELPSGSLIQIPDMQLASSWPAARSNLNRLNSSDCCKAAGAQHIRNFSLDAAYDSQNWTLFLLPMYSTYYLDDEGKKFAVYVNGTSGQMSGVRMASQKKGWRIAGIMAAVAVMLLVLGLISFAAAALFVPASVIGTIFVVLALALGAAAIFPAVWPWMWNNGQMEKSDQEDS